MIQLFHGEPAFSASDILLRFSWDRRETRRTVAKDAEDRSRGDEIERNASGDFLKDSAEGKRKAARFSAHRFPHTRDACTRSMSNRRLAFSPRDWFPKTVSLAEDNSRETFLVPDAFFVGLLEIKLSAERNPRCGGTPARSGL